MKIAIMQPYLFPYIGYYQLINAVDKFILYDNVQYVKRSWINRNRLRFSTHAASLFTLPLKKTSRSDLISDKKIDENEFLKLKHKLFKAIELNYSSADFKCEGIKILESCFSSKNTSLFEFLQLTIIAITRYLEIDTPIDVASEISINNDLKGQNKIMDICKKNKCTEYWNVFAGYDLYRFEDFEAQDIQLKFIKTENNLIYNQKKKNFLPNLSILDVIMHNHKDDINKFLLKYEVIRSL